MQRWLRKIGTARIPPRRRAIPLCWAGSPRSAAAPQWANFGWLRLTDRLAWLVWGVAHIYFLIGIRNRMAVAIDWLWSYLTYQRGAPRSRKRLGRLVGFNGGTGMEACQAASSALDSASLVHPAQIRQSASSVDISTMRSSPMMISRHQRPPPRDRKFADSPLEEAVRSELVSEMGFLDRFWHLKSWLQW